MPGGSLGEKERTIDSCKKLFASQCTVNIGHRQLVKSRAILNSVRCERKEIQSLNDLAQSANENRRRVECSVRSLGIAKSCPRAQKTKNHLHPSHHSLGWNIENREFAQEFRSTTQDERHRRVVIIFGYTQFPKCF